jgi:hypothetical protein
LVVNSKFLDFFRHSAGVTQRGLLLFTELSVHAEGYFALVVNSKFLDFFRRSAGVTQRGGLLLFTELSVNVDVDFTCWSGTNLLM